MHGVLHGYDVAVLKDCVAGASAPDNWKTTGDDANAPLRPCGKSLSANTCTADQLNEWRRQIFLGYKGGPE